MNKAELQTEVIRLTAEVQRLREVNVRAMGVLGADLGTMSRIVRRLGLDEKGSLVEMGSQIEAFLLKKGLLINP